MYSYSMADTSWLTVPDIAELLDISPVQVRELIREKHLVAIRRGENNALHVPALSIATTDAGSEILPHLRGTIILLSDARFSDEQIVDWLISEDEELGEAPLQALANGKRAHVRRVAQSL